MLTYATDVATSKFGCFIKVLFRWKGSVYKVIWKDLIIFLVIYYIIYFSYMFGMNDPKKRVFERVCKYFDNLMGEIPLAFVLGFYLSEIVSRYYVQYGQVGWPNRTSVLLTTYLRGQDERGRLLRRTIVRYLVICFVMTMRSISPVILRRFPTLGSLTEFGIMTPDEQHILENIKTPHNKYSIPMVWASTLVIKARMEGRIEDDMAVCLIFKKMNIYRDFSLTLFLMDAVGIPLVYTQIMTLAVYLQFVLALFGRQPTETANFYIPFKTIIEFVMYFGLLDTAAALINPFGDDDDDFCINEYIDRYATFTYIIVDDVHRKHPDIIDKPGYTEALQTQQPLDLRPADRLEGGSLIDLHLSDSKTQFVIRTTSTEVGEQEAETQDRKTPTRKRSVISDLENQLPTVPEESKQEKRMLSSLKKMSPQYVTERPACSAFENRFEEVSGIDHTTGQVNEVPSEMSASDTSSEVSRMLLSVTNKLLKKGKKVHKKDRKKDRKKMDHKKPDQDKPDQDRPDQDKPDQEKL